MQPATAAEPRLSTFLCSLLLGSLAAVLLPFPTLVSPGLIGIAAGICGLSVRNRIPPAVSQKLAGLSFGVLGYGLGVVLTVMQVQDSAGAWRSAPVSLTGQPVQVERCWSSQWHTRCLVRQLTSGQGWYLQWRADSRPVPGQSGVAKVELTPAAVTMVPGETSFALWLLRHRISARGHLSDFVPTTQSHWMQITLAVRDWLRQRPLSPVAEGVYQALVLGDRAAMDDTLRGKVTRTQTQHLLALSGLHIGTLALWAFAIAGLVWRLWPVGVRQDWQKAAAIFMAGLLLWVALPAVSLWRAFLMTLLPAILFCVRRRLARHQVLLVIAVVMVLADPLIWLDMGAWFSWWATLLLVMLVRQIGHWPSWQQLLIIQVVLSVLLLPVYALWQLPVYPAGVAVNLLLIPWVTLVALPSAFLTAVQLPGAAWVFEQAVMVWVWLLEVFDRPWVFLPVLSPGWVLLAMALTAIALLWRARITTWCMGILMLAAVSWHQSQPTRLAAGEFEIWVLAVGNAQSVVIDTGAGRVLFGTGWGTRDQVHAGQAALRWHWNSPHRPWYAVVTAHDGLAQSGGLASVAQAVMPEHWYSSAPPSYRPDGWPQPQFCDQVVGFELNEVRFEFLRAAPGYRPADDQAASCVLRVDGRYHSALVMGDLPRREEYRLLSRQAMLPVTLLLSARQGADTATSQALLQATQPTVVVHSAAEYSTWTRPHPAVISRVEQAGAENHCTCWAQTLRYRSQSGGLIQAGYGNRLLPWLKIGRH